MADSGKSSTLYPDGFNAARFVEVVESEAVWEELGKKPPSPYEDVKLVSGPDLVALVRFERGAKGQLRISRVFR